MIQIRPVSDLRNKFPEIETIVNNGEPVYLTKNGYGAMAFSDLESEEGAKSTMNMQMESFYEGARNADILIYNSAIDGELQTVDQLLEKSGVLADFKAVREGNVWCTGKNLFQESLGLGDLITDLHTVLSGEDGGLTYLHHLD